MSADNGIYVARFPMAGFNLGHIYHVADCAAIDNTEDGDQNSNDWYRWRLFGRAPTFYTEWQAIEYAQLLSKSRWTEYGVVYLRFNRPLNPNAKDPWKQDDQGLLPCG